MSPLYQAGWGEGVGGPPLHVAGVVGEGPPGVLEAGGHVREDSPDVLTNLSPLPT